MKIDRKYITPSFFSVFQPFIFQVIHKLKNGAFGFKWLEKKSCDIGPTEDLTDRVFLYYLLHLSFSINFQEILLEIGSLFAKIRRNNMAFSAEEPLILIMK